ncbi:hypothetical protein [Arthrobacter sp. B2a2-09]|uniref:hypothetical protein n=1 Tax=Arthrobacter sp. B2a2-09 TaxID=2952822 RepID=UPI0022CDAA45|nr:hypothetical protein [Arthrobacter sp. B2a2-09]MCZ9884607.1 hypothetical protein [Arthrobacter sp. B2a2-09]
MAREQKVSKKASDRRGWALKYKKKGATPEKIVEIEGKPSVIGTILTQNGVVVIRDAKGREVDPETLGDDLSRYVVIKRPDTRVEKEYRRKTVRTEEDPKHPNVPKLSGLKTAKPSRRDRQPAEIEPKTPKGKPAKKGWFK